MTIQRIEDGERLVAELELILKGEASMRRDYLLAGQSLSHRQPMRNAGVHKRVAAPYKPFWLVRIIEKKLLLRFR
jgi:hypothetical protein